MVKFMPDCIVVVGTIVLVECHDVVDSLRVLSLFVLANAVLLQDSLPFFWQALKEGLARIILHTFKRW